MTPRGKIEIGEIQGAYGFALPPSGSTRAVELDASRNTSMSRKLYLSAGKYDLRYWVRDRVPFTDYDPAWLCSNRAEGIVLPNVEGQTDTNRVAAYIDVALDDKAPVNLVPETNNLIDVCLVTGGRWIERQFTITVKSPGFFWLTFQAEGKSDGFGSLITDILLCKDKCKDEPSENFPWAANTLLFSDSFESQTGDGNWTERTLDNSGANQGWPRLPTGWTTWPRNQVDFQQEGLTGDGTPTRVELDSSYIPQADGTRGPTPDDPTSNRAISRRFVLVPGYYEIKYLYSTMRAVFGSSAPLLSKYPTYCGLDVNSLTEQIRAMSEGRVRGSDIVRVFMDPDTQVSHPVSEPVLRAQAQWKNPDGSPATLPRLPETAIDACVFSGAEVLRTVRFKISKAGFYWFTVQGEGAADQWGGAIDAFRMTALGGLRTSVPDAIPIPFSGTLQTTTALPGLEIVSN